MWPTENRLMQGGALKILHLTHTDVRVDSRILKELSALEEVGIYQLYAIGIAELGVEGGVCARHSADVITLKVIFKIRPFKPL